MKGKKLTALILISLLTSGMVCSAFASEAEEPLPDAGETSDVLEISITNETGEPIYGLTALDEAQTERHEFETDSDQLVGDGETYVMRCLPEDISLVFYTGGGDEYILYTFPVEDMSEAELCLRNGIAYIKYPSISKNITINTRTKETTLRDDLEAAEEVSGQIEAVGAVNGDKQAAVRAAREAYDALYDRQKEYVTNVDLLEEMEAGAAAETEEKEAEAAADTGEAAADTGENAQTDEGDGYDVFSDLGGRQFGFSSGAGSWNSEMTVYADGTFAGSFYDSYPQTGTAADGSYYMGGTDISEFSGKFAAAEKINDYTYSTRVESLSYQNPVGTQEVIDGVLYSYVEAYGISEGDEFLIYLPTTPLSALPDEAIANHSAAFTNGSYAGRYVLDNETGYGFYIQTIDS